jgi:putative transposase
MAINTDLIDELLKDYKEPDDVLGENGLLKQLTKAVLRRAMQAELTHHLGYSKHDPKGNKSGNSHNGNAQKTLKGDFGTHPIEVPRDRNATFEPQIIPKNQTRFEGFDDKILSLYARGLTTRQIKQHLEEIYQVEVSPSLISTVTDAVLDEVRIWQSRPLEALYPVVYFDCLRVKIGDGGQILNKAIYLAVGLTGAGQKEALGLWIAQTEGAKFWMSVMSELRNRGVADILIACVDGLKGFPEAIEAVFPEVQVQQCIVHQVRASLS